MRQYLYGAILLALVGSHWWMYHHGQDVESNRNQAAILKAKAREDQLIADLEAEKAKREVRYRDRIVYVEKMVGECLDVPLPADLVDRLRPDHGPAVSGADG